MQPYTSGSTGKPKGVLLTHGGQIWNADIMRKALLCDDTERALVAVPLFHKNAMAGAVKPFLLAGGSLVILPGFDAVEVIRAIDRYQVTYLTGVPAMYKMILAEKEALARHDVVQRALRAVRLGGGARGAAGRVPPASSARRSARATGSPRAGRCRSSTRAGGSRSAARAGVAFPGCDVQLRRRGEPRRRRGRGGRAGDPQPGAGQGLLEAAGGRPPRSSATAGSTPATSCAATPTATTTSSAARTT